ncbi:MAG TPA: NAD-dependent epimerase/dehydratase family protein [Levilinea sp.]|nr:NAD-dependent epimerase/dehydratase family protein [Levilinea sp.]
MNILVTGSTGFIGSHLVRKLIEMGHTVRAFYRSSSASRSLENLPVEHVLGDLTQPESIRAAMQDIEIVFHAAAMSGGRDDPGRMYAVTVEGTRAVLQAARAAGVHRLVYTSSVAALGVPDQAQSPGLRPPLINENHTWNFPPEYWPHGYAKYLAELEVQRAIASGLDVVIVNPSVVFGRGDVYRQNSSLVVQIARQRLHMITSGGMNIVHIDDVVAGHLAALERGQCGERYILGGENMTLLEVVSMIGEVVGKPPPRVMIPVSLVRLLTPPARILAPFLSLPVDISILRLVGRYFYYDLRKSFSELGLAPPRQAVQAVTDAYNWFRTAGAVG